MNTNAFSDSAVIRAAWQRVKDRLGFLVILGIILGVFFIAVSALLAWIGSESEVGYVIANIVYWVVASLIGIGMLKIVLDIADGKDGDLADLVKHWNVLLKYIGATILYTLVVYAGMFLLIFPGVIWSLKFFFTPWLVIDKGMGPINAMKASSRMTMGMKWDLLGFIAVGYTVLFIGVLCLGIGVILTGPLFAIATAMVYRHMEKGVDLKEFMPDAAPAVKAPAA